MEWLRARKSNAPSPRLSLVPALREWMPPTTQPAANHLPYFGKRSYFNIHVRQLGFKGNHKGKLAPFRGAFLSRAHMCAHVGLSTLWNELPPDKQGLFDKKLIGGLAMAGRFPAFFPGLMWANHLFKLQKNRGRRSVQRVLNLSTENFARLLHALLLLNQEGPHDPGADLR